MARKDKDELKRQDFEVEPESTGLNPDRESQVREIPVGEEDESPEVDTGTKPEAAEVDPMVALENRVAELEEQKLLALADLDNFRKRMHKRLEETVQTANDRLLSELLEVVDNFERALAHAGETQENDEAAFEGFKRGMEMIYGQLQAILERYHVRPIEAVGRRFDPEYHEALMRVASDTYAEGTVVEEINRGYMVGNRVLRHARVAVSTGEEKKDE